MPKSKNIEIDNFLKMSPDLPEYSDRNPHYLIAGANPTYYTDSNGIQEQQLAPLAASLNWSQISSSLDGNVICMIPASIASGSGFSVFLMTSTTQVFGIKSSGGVPTSVVSLGYPSGSSVPGTTHADMCSANGYLYAGYELNSNIWALNNFTTPSWSSKSISYVTFGNNSFLLPFLDYVMINSATYVMKFDGSFSSNAGLNLGTGWQIYGVENYNEKYMAIAASRTSGYDYTQNYLFLWDGISSTYNYAMRIPGTYLDMKCINSVLYVSLALTKDKTAVYQMNNNFLVPYFTTPYLNVDQTGFIGTQPVDIKNLFNWKGEVGVRLNSNSSLTSPLMIYERSTDGISQFILSSGQKFSRIVVGCDGILYGSNFVSGGDDSLYYYPTTNSYSQPLLYISQWIPIEGTLGAIDIVYDTPPQSSGDSINVTLNGYGQNIINGYESVTLTSITSTNTRTNRTTLLDPGSFDPDVLQIVLTTVNNSTWRPIIRGITININ